MNISAHSRAQFAAFLTFVGARALACATFFFLFGLPNQARAENDQTIDARVRAENDRLVDVLFESYLQALKPDDRQLSFWKLIEEIRNERKMGRPDRALEIAKHVASLVTEDPELLSITESQIGEIHVDLKQWATAKTHFSNALRLEENRVAKDVERFEGPLMWLAGVSIKLEELNSAEEYYVRLLQMTQKIYGTLSYRTIGQLWALANLGLRQNDLPKAEKFIKQELDIVASKPSFLGVSLAEPTKALQNLGAVRAHQGKLAHAISLHLQARELLHAPIRSASKEERAVGAGDLARAIECEERLVYLYIKAGNKKKVEMHSRAHQNLLALVTQPPITVSDALWFQTLLPLP